MEKTITILGINGRIGQEAARAFVAAGWQVTGMGRADRVHIPGVNFIAGNAESPADVARAAAPSEVVLDAVNLPYDKWDKGRYENSLAARLNGLKGSGKTLLYPGNIYNFAAETHVLTPDTPENPARDKGEIRVRLEQMLKRATDRGQSAGHHPARARLFRSGRHRHHVRPHHAARTSTRASCSIPAIRGSAIPGPICPISPAPSSVSPRNGTTSNASTGCILPASSGPGIELAASAERALGRRLDAEAGQLAALQADRSGRADRQGSPQDELSLGRPRTGSPTRVSTPCSAPIS